MRVIIHSRDAVGPFAVKFCFDEGSSLHPLISDYFWLGSECNWWPSNGGLVTVKGEQVAEIHTHAPLTSPSEKQHIFTVKLLRASVPAFFFSPGARRVQENLISIPRTDCLTTPESDWGSLPHNTHTGLRWFYDCNTASSRHSLHQI